MTSWPRNDPWKGTGHIFDINVMRPVFRQDRLVAYVISVTHLPDIGGTGYGASSSSQFEEGLLIPASKIVEAGTVKSVFRGAHRSEYACA